IQCYIVYLGAHSHGPTPSSAGLQIATSSHYILEPKFFIEVPDKMSNSNMGDACKDNIRNHKASCSKENAKNITFCPNEILNIFLKTMNIVGPVVSDSIRYETTGSNEQNAKEKIIYSYNKQINGFAAMLQEEEAAQIAKNEKVVSVFMSKEHKLHTTRSWEFLGLRRNDMSSAWQKGRFGENTIISNIDSGVWPESMSFSDRGIGHSCSILFT
ncbi:subtilisin-like protease Glyma18g48580, partial [Vicia villosa]|uniref:subtilisin-like protease Glyma18g48580 n=1 Tax=Vicia villosa TaxID=3911 RepID=UPI00273A7D64